jgi:hypothetical protein
MSSLDQRVQILRRLRLYLERQRERFVSYLYLLEQQGAVIRAGDVDRLQHHVELEQTIIHDIDALERAIVPLEELYRHSFPHQEPSIGALKSSLQQVREQALVRNSENQKMLRERLESLRLEIKEVRRRGKPALSPYTRIGEPKLVDIRS